MHISYLAETFRFRVFLEREGGEVDACSENFGLGQDTDTADSVDFHLDVWVTVGVAEVGQVGTPGGVFGVPFDDNCILIEGIGKGECCFRFLPGIQVVRLLAAKPVRQRTPDIFSEPPCQ